MQEVFLRVWNQIHTAYEIGLDNCRYWIFKITKNLVTDHYRSRTTRNIAENRLKQDCLVYTEFSRSPEEVYETKSNVRRINDVINQLPNDLRSVLILHFIGQLKSADIAELLEIPAGTVRYRISTARKRILNELTNSAIIGEGR